MIRHDFDKNGKADSENTVLRHNAVITRVYQTQQVTNKRSARGVLKC